MSQFSLARALVAAGAAFAFACPSTALADPPGCVAIQFVVARGTAEPAGYSLALDGGVGGPTNPTSVYTYAKNELTNPTDGSTPMSGTTISRHDIDYPADVPVPSSGDDSTLFRQSVRKGTQKVIEFINAQHAYCPSQRFVLLGYSQGALVMMNAITPDLSKRIMMDSAPIPTLSATAYDKIAAIGTFADAGLNQANGWTTHAPTTVSSTAPAYLQGTFDDLTRGRNDGNSSLISTAPYVRSLTATTAHDSRIRTYCVKDDWICQGSGNPPEHLYYGDPAKPGPRRNLAIFVVQQLRNAFNKTYASAQCTFISASNSSWVGQPFSLTLRVEGTVNDRATVGSSNTTSNIKTNLAFNANQSAALFSALNNPTGIRKTTVFLPLESTMTTNGVADTQHASVLGFNDTVVPSGSGFNVNVPGGTQSPSWSTTWGARSVPGVAELKVGDEFSVLVYGQGSGTATLDCNLSSQPAAEFAGRHFGRVVVG